MKRNELLNTILLVVCDCMELEADDVLSSNRSEELARADVEKMHSVGKDGVEHHGAHWSPEEVEAATADKTFGKNVTKFDRFVAYNAFFHDLHNVLDDKQILEAAYAFWFDDKDWKSSGKIWDYMSANK